MSIKDVAPYKGKRRKLLEVLVNVDNAELGVDATCKSAGITRPLYYKYIGEPDFQNALRAIVTRNYARFAPQIGNSMVKIAKKGNVKAASLVFEMLKWAGRDGPSQVVNVGVSNESVDTTTPFDNPTEALAVIDMELERLNKQRADIATRAGNRLDPHGIHPEQAPVADADKGKEK